MNNIFVDFFKSVFYCFKTPKDPFDNFFGMIGFAGYYGQGKSMALTDTINRYLKLALKYNRTVKVYTNYYYNGQDSQLTCLDDIEKLCDYKRKCDPDSYYIFAIDELQNALSSRNWNDTKKLENLLPIFTMTRKLKVMFLYTTPVSSMSDKTVRISSRAIYLCKKINRFFFVRWRLSPIELEGNLKEIKLSLLPTSYTFLDDTIKNSYDSYAFIETLQKQDYLKHTELVDSSVNVSNSIRVSKTKKRIVSRSV